MVNQILSINNGVAAIHNCDDGTSELAIYKDGHTTLYTLNPSDTFQQIRDKALECLGVQYRQ